MTDKQIIIDGVEVSGCPHLIEDYQWWNIAGREEHDINRCALSFDDYRDFEEDDFCKDNPNCYYKQLKAKEQECEELKRQHQADKGLITSTGKQNYQLIQEYDKLKTALAEIKEIAEDAKTKVFVDMEEFWKQILQKISECEVNDEKH